eukprot:Partr_v1_DN27714_c0_g1_i2_m67547
MTCGSMEHYHSPPPPADTRNRHTQISQATRTHAVPKNIPGLARMTTRVTQAVQRDKETQIRDLHTLKIHSNPTNTRPGGETDSDNIRERISSTRIPGSSDRIPEQQSEQDETEEETLAVAVEAAAEARKKKSASRKRALIDSDDLGPNLNDDSIPHTNPSSSRVVVIVACKEQDRGVEVDKNLDCPKPPQPLAQLPRIQITSHSSTTAASINSPATLAQTSRAANTSTTGNNNKTRTSRRKRMPKKKRPSRPPPLLPGATILASLSSTSNGGSTTNTPLSSVPRSLSSPSISGSPSSPSSGSPMRSISPRRRGSEMSSQLVNNNNRDSPISNHQLGGGGGPTPAAAEVIRRMLEIGARFYAQACSVSTQSSSAVTSPVDALSPVSSSVNVSTPVGPLPAADDQSRRRRSRTVTLDDRALCLQPDEQHSLRNHLHSPMPPSLGAPSSSFVGHARSKSFSGDELMLRDLALSATKVVSDPRLAGFKSDLVKFLHTVTVQSLGVENYREDLVRYPRVYYPIYEHANFTCGIFALRAGASLPLHDHPQMTVFTRVLDGRISCRSLDFILNDDLPLPNGHVRARVCPELFLTERSEISIVNPDHRNIHRIQALEDSLFIDIIGPPYSDLLPCSYFEEMVPDASGMAMDFDVLVLKPVACSLDIEALTYPRQSNSNSSINSLSVPAVPPSLSGSSTGTSPSTTMRQLSDAGMSPRRSSFNTFNGQN